MQNCIWGGEWAREQTAGVWDMRVLQFCGTWEGKKLEAVAKGISPPGSVVCLSVVGLQHFLSEASVSDASHLFRAFPYAALQTCAPESLDWHSSRRNS